MKDWKQKIRQRLAGLNLAPVRESQIVEEILIHVEDRYEELLSEGVNTNEASRRAVSELIDNDLLLQGLVEVRGLNERYDFIPETRRTNMFVQFLNDLRFGARLLRKNPVFSLMAILSLALGIGANTAIFQLLNAVEMKKLPVRNPSELAKIQLQHMNGARGGFFGSYRTVTYHIWEQIRDRQQGFSGIFAWATDQNNLAQGGEIRLGKTLWMSGNGFDVLGVHALIGRTFTATEDQRGCSGAGAVISYSFWQREYGGEPGVIGKRLTLRNHPFEIIGVAEKSFFGLEVGHSFDVALPICAEPIVRGNNENLDSGTNWWLMVTGRLKPGWSLAKANADLQTISPALFETTLPPKYPDENLKDYLNFKLEAVSVESGYSILRAGYQRPLWLLLAIAALVLFIACANLANLLLAQASVREREIALRQAIGASRWRVIRQLLAESLLLATIGAGLGALLAQGLSRILVSLLTTSDEKIFLDLTLDWRVPGFAMAVAFLTCMLFGLAPSIRATRVSPDAAMKSGARGLTTGHRGFSFRRALIVIQVAISLVLVASALLFARSLNKLMHSPTGFKEEGVMIVQTDFKHLNLEAAQINSFQQQIREKLSAIPGIDSVGITNYVPLDGNSMDNNVWPEHKSGEKRIDSLFDPVGQGFFKTMGIPLLAGRDFNDHDEANSPLVAVVNESFARKIFDGQNPIGKRFWVEAVAEDPKKLYEIIGLVKDAKYGDLREDFPPIAYLAASQDVDPSPNVQLVIHSKLSDGETTIQLKRALTEINPSMDINLKGFRTLINDSVVRDRLMAFLSGLFGLLALLLASVGLYGILSFDVVSRTREIGIRMALGAQSRELRLLILRQALIQVMLGIVIGLPLVVLATRFASSLLYGLAPTDPVSLALASAIMIGVSLVAAYYPAMRATRVDPMVALRSE